MQTRGSKRGAIVLDEEVPTVAQSVEMEQLQKKLNDELGKNRKLMASKYADNAAEKRQMQEMKRKIQKLEKSNKEPRKKKEKVDAKMEDFEDGKDRMDEEGKLCKKSRRNGKCKCNHEGTAGTG